MAEDSVVVRAGRRLAASATRFGHGLRELAMASPSRFAVLVFLALILLFTALFSLPAASADGTRTPFADALFTAVSTICVTGLSTVDMATHWSAFGHVIVYIGVNVGALGVLTLASILGLVISKRLGLRAKLIAAGDTNPLRAHGGPVNEGQTVRLGETVFEISHTPGHTLGHIVFRSVADDLAFVGDVIFPLGCGRLFEGTPEQMWNSFQTI